MDPEIRKILLAAYDAVCAITGPEYGLETLNTHLAGKESAYRILVMADTPLIVIFVDESGEGGDTIG